MKNKIVIVIPHLITHRTLGSLATALLQKEYHVIALCNSDQTYKPSINPYLNRHFLSEVPYTEIQWYGDNQDLQHKLSIISPAVVFSMEGVPFYYDETDFSDRDYLSINIAYNTDNCHEKIRNRSVDKTVCISEDYAVDMGWEKGTYLPLGSPKYDSILHFDRDEIRSKYKLPDKYILLFAPNKKWSETGYLKNMGDKVAHKFYRHRDMVSFTLLEKIVSQIRSHGYECVIKGRTPKAHDPSWKKLSDYYFLETQYFPGPKLELLFASEGACGFDSTVVEEVLMSRKLYVNFNIKRYRTTAAETNWKNLIKMWESEFCLDIPTFSANRLFFPEGVHEFMPHFKKTNIDWDKVQGDLSYRLCNASEKIIENMEKVQLHKSRMY